jgi:hypothetical protein
MKADAEVLRPRALATSLGLLALVAAGASWLAAGSPDGLQRVASTLGFAEPGRPVWTVSPVTGYLVPGIANETLAGILAGLAGILVTGALVYAAARSLSRRRSTDR